MSTTEIPKRFAMNAAVTVSLEDRLADLGGIAPSRVRAIPAPGSATLVDLIEAQVKGDRLCELIDGTLVEKPMGWQESLLAMFLVRWLGNFLESHPMDVVTGPQKKKSLTDAMSCPVGPSIWDVCLANWTEGASRREPCLIRQHALAVCCFSATPTFALKVFHGSPTDMNVHPTDDRSVWPVT